MKPGAETKVIELEREAGALQLHHIEDDTIAHHGYQCELHSLIHDVAKVNLPSC